MRSKTWPRRVAIALILAVGAALASALPALASGNQMIWN
jgi:hypothetical protein